MRQVLIGVNKSLVLQIKPLICMPWKLLVLPGSILPRMTGFSQVFLRLHVGSGDGHIYTERKTDLENKMVKS